MRREGALRCVVRGWVALSTSWDGVGVPPPVHVYYVIFRLVEVLRSDVAKSKFKFIQIY